ncbi:hypothetical protein [Cellulomonas aerilata]|uniref:Adenylyltransferase n=1 Tax=Cellulomonas aerilata TaxID=515326 RepID=A0A512D7G1_9CELL|nr:hypothetical protein [Cellulomonas aerilata]GEO32416.1 adenylyltransferase [Cellulomonas aerilata]
MRRARLTNIVRHAVEHTDFYAGHEPDHLADLPVVDKMTFRTQGPAMLARGVDRSTLHPHYTSGSTGIPFESLWDAGKVLRNQADTVALAERAGYRLGTPLLYLRAWGGQYGKGRLRRLKEGITPIEVRTLDASRAREVLLAIRRRSHPVMMLGYGSALEELCRASERTGIDVRGRVAGVIAFGETPTTYLRTAVPVTFGRPLVARYSNTENGLIAQQEPGESAYRINVAGYHVEILRHGSDEPADPGEEGRIVLTDLFNRAMPFVRYDTGDLGAFGADEDGIVDDTVLVSMSGRTYDRLFDTHGRFVNPMVTPELADYDLRQFQLVQTGHGRYTLRINADRDPERDARIRAEFLDVLGADADLRFEYVDEVPLLSSGKRRPVLNEWRPGQ